MELRDVIYQMIQQSLQASQPADLRVGTVMGTDPLEISINPAMAPLRREVLLLTAGVVEKTLHTGGGSTTTYCTENGVRLPVSGGDVTLNRALAAGDKALLLRVQSGKKFIVLSRIF